MDFLIYRECVAYCNPSEQLVFSRVPAVLLVNLGGKGLLAFAFEGSFPANVDPFEELEHIVGGKVFEIFEIYVVELLGLLQGLHIEAIL